VIVSRVKPCSRIQLRRAACASHAIASRFDQKVASLSKIRPVVNIEIRFRRLPTSLMGAFLATPITLFLLPPTVVQVPNVTLGLPKKPLRHTFIDYYRICASDLSRSSKFPASAQYGVPIVFRKFL